MDIAANRLELSRRGFMVNGALATLPWLAVLPGCGELSDQPICIASHVWVGYEPMFLARDKTWLDPRQVQLLETTSVAESLQAVAQGKAHGAAVTLDEMLGARAAGLALSLVMIFDVSLGADMLVTRPGIKDLADLKGHRIGFEASSVGELMLWEILKLAGLTRRDVQLEAIPVSQQPAAWQHQKVDAFITYEPVASRLLEAGMLRLFDSRQIPNTIIDVLVMRRDALGSSHASAIRHLIQSHFKALDHLMRSPQDAAYRMASHLNLPATGVLAAYKGLVLPNAANNFRLLAGKHPELLATAGRVSKLMFESGLLKQPDTLDELIRAEFLPTDDLLR